MVRGESSKLGLVMEWGTGDLEPWQVKRVGLGGGEKCEGHMDP